MPWIKTFKLDPSQISTIQSTEVRGLTSVTLSCAGDDVSISTHGRPWIHSQFTDNLQWELTLESHTHIKSIVAGSVITNMTLHCIERDQGSGTMSGGEQFDISFAANCGAVVTNVEHSINHAGASTWKITMKTFSSDGNTNPITIS